MLCWLTVPGDDCGAPRSTRGRRRDGLLRAPSSTRSPRRAVAGAGPGAAQGRHRPLARRRTARATGRSWSTAARARRGATGRAGHRRLVALRLQRRARRTPPTTPRSGLPRGPRRSPRPPGCARRCATSPTPRRAILRPSVPVRPGARAGIASYGLDPAPGRHAATSGCVPAMTARARSRMAKPIAAGDGVSYGHTWVADQPTTRRAGAGGVRRRRPAARAATRAEVLGRRASAARSAAGSAWTSSSSTSTATLPGAGRRGRAVRRRATTASRPRRTGPRPAARSTTRSSPGSGAGCTRRYVDTEHDETIEA